MNKINSQPSKGLLVGGKYCCSTKRKTNKNMFFANIFFFNSEIIQFLAREWCPSVALAKWRDSNSSGQGDSVLE